MTTATDALLAATDETRRLVEDAQIVLGKLSARLSTLEVEGDYTTVRYLHKRILSVERAMQRRSAS